MALRSPRKLKFGSPPRGKPEEEVPVFWDSDAKFGKYLKDVRERRGWTTREAAEKWGVSQAYVTKLENQSRKRPPGTSLIHQVADLYGLEVGEVMHEAGFRFDIPPSLELKVGVDKAFRKLLNDARFRPGGFQPDEERYIPQLVKQQFLDVALNVARVVRDDEDFDLEAWLREEGAE